MNVPVEHQIHTLVRQITDRMYSEHVHSMAALNVESLLA